MSTRTRYLCSSATWNRAVAGLRPILAVLIVAVALSGCIAQDLYKVGQEHQRDKCRNGPPSNYDECMRRANESYETYQRNRREVEENP